MEKLYKKIKRCENLDIQEALSKSKIIDVDIERDILLIREYMIKSETTE